MLQTLLIRPSHGVVSGVKEIILPIFNFKYLLPTWVSYNKLDLLVERSVI